MDCIHARHHMSRPFVAGLAAGLVLAASLALAGAPAPLPPPGPRDRCPVCGMFVKPYPTWMAALRFPGGRVEYFDGPKDLFRRYFALGPEGKKAEPLVTDYYSTRVIPAREAWFVSGSDILGPMGHELVPLASEGEARGFKRDHGGASPLAFESVTPQTMKDLE
jgi:copper chaperone NosL